ncbi:group I intron-associated PD-(D/E)XK endonuclease [Phytohabitans aurantiacus]|uniref:group I intron-associated PD-(D/E)XK endonuclease n=1 Tax=Phytohabitans aurantiacus TaxID=3016789 RepID=UPI002490FD80|nr:group I intron-associated PD-(D/E)XK endonuclease [Phytohabitans aurantiacus]
MRAPGWIRTSGLGLDTSHFDRRRSHRVVESPPLPFGHQPKPGSSSGLSIAARWFLDRGYNVSVPLEPAPYDLITESDRGLMRVQVKTTSKVGRNGRCVVRIARKLYDPTVPKNALGSYRMVPYEATDVDLFFVITAAGPIYLVPIESVTGSISLVLDEKYRAFAVDG